MVAAAVSVFFWIASGFTTPVVRRQKNVRAGAAGCIHVYKSSGARDDKLHIDGSEKTRQVYNGSAVILLRCISSGGVGKRLGGRTSTPSRLQMKTAAAKLIRIAIQLPRVLASIMTLRMKYGVTHPRGITPNVSPPRLSFARVSRGRSHVGPPKRGVGD